MTKIFLALLTCSAILAGDFVKLVVANDAACVLGYSANDSIARDMKIAGCWNKDATPLELPALEPMTDLAVGHRLGGVYGSFICATNQLKIECKGEQGSKIQRLFSSLKQPHLISAGNYDICAVDKDVGIKCHGGEIPEVRWTLVTETAPSLTNISEISLGTFYACAIHSGNKIHCWGGVRDAFASLVEEKTRSKLKDIHSSLVNPPGDLEAPHDLTVGLSHACVVDKGKPRCWGLALEKETLFPQNLGFVQGINASLKRTCLIIGGQVFCIGQNDATVQNLIEKQESEFPLAISTNHDQGQRSLSTCWIEPESLTCKGKLNFTIKHSILGFHLFNIENEFERLARHIYEWKSPIFSRAAQQIRKNAEKQPEGRLFLANLLKPFIANIQNNYFETAVAPRFSKLVDYYNVRHSKSGGLTEFEKNDLNARLSLYLLRETYSVSRGLLSEKEELAAVSELESLIIRALAAPKIATGELTPVVNQIHKMKGLSERLAVTPAATGIMALANSIIQFLK